MKVKELLKMYRGEYTDYELYVPATRSNHPEFHTDNCQCVYQWSTDYQDSSVNIEEILEMEADIYELMNEEDYSNSIHANSSEPVDFAEWYDDKNAKVLCVMIK